MIDPSITFELTTLPTFDYIGIPIFNRYYFVKNITNVGENLWQVDMHVDVRESYRTQILNCPCVCERQENAGNLYLADERMPVLDKTFTTTERIGTHAFTSDFYILICQ